MAVREHCGNCAFAVRPYGGGLFCHKRAPIVVNKVVGFQVGRGVAAGGKDIMELRTAWPEVGLGEFCGEWELQDVQDDRT
jgi:hypothetical protein